MLSQENLAKIQVVPFFRWSQLNSFLQRLHRLLRPSLLLLAPAQQIEDRRIPVSGIDQGLKNLLALRESTGMIFDQSQDVIEPGLVGECRPDESKEFLCS